MTDQDKSQPKPTVLHDRHKAAGARLIDFGGWHMPVQYKPGIVKEHRHVREAIGIFDVSHMGEVVLSGADAGAAVQRLITNDLNKIGDGAALYTVMCYEDGGIVDDCIVYRRSETEYLIILNASNVAKDLAWIRQNVGDTVNVDDQSEATALIAVQGPHAVELCNSLASVDLAAVKRFHFASCEVAGARVMAARTGYTGEDGFEMAMPADQATMVWDALMADERVAPIGLGARDTLRLEAKLCLYGNDIDKTTTPYEAGLGWVVKPAAGDFIGKEALVAQKAEGLKRKLVGFRMQGRGIARHGYNIIDRDQAEPIVGHVTSGTSGITVGGAIGMGYVPIALSKTDTKLTIDCRGKDVAAVVVKGAFYKRT